MKRERERSELTLKRLRAPGRPLRVAWAHPVPGGLYLGNPIDYDDIIVCSNCGAGCMGPQLARLRLDTCRSQVMYEKRGVLFKRSITWPTPLPRWHRTVSGWAGPSGRITFTMHKSCWNCGARLDWRGFVRRFPTYWRQTRRTVMPIGRYSAASATTPE